MPDRITRGLFGLFYNIRQPSFILPLALVAPAVAIGPYGVRLTDLMVILLGGYFLVAIVKGVRLPRFMIVFLALWTFGWAFANLNGMRYGINFDLFDLNHFYRVLFFISALLIGLHSPEPVDKIFGSPFALLCYGFVVFMCVSYYMGGQYDRITMLSPFFADPTVLRDNIQGWQFPGLGNSRNSYTASILMVFVFVFHKAFKTHKGYFAAFLLIAIILFSGGRRAIAQAVFAAFVIIAAVAVFAPSTRAFFVTKKGIMVRRERLPQLVALGLFLVVAGGALSQVQVGQNIGFRFVMLFSGERTGESGLARRLINMMGGVDRVAAAPILGVPRVKPGDRAFPHILEFSYPHNEYLMIWMFYGLLGLIAYLYLFAVLFYLNVRHRMSVKWLLVYFGMMVQMLVDIAFFDFQITTIFFIIVGLNIREMHRKEAAAVTKAGSPAVSLRV